MCAALLFLCRSLIARQRYKAVSFYGGKFPFLNHFATHHYIHDHHVVAALLSALSIWLSCVFWTWLLVLWTYPTIGTSGNCWPSSVVPLIGLLLLPVLFFLPIGPWSSTRFSLLVVLCQVSFVGPSCSTTLIVVPRFLQQQYGPSGECPSSPTCWPIFSLH
jgi:hypothetical protein